MDEEIDGLRDKVKELEDVVYNDSEQTGGNKYQEGHVARDTEKDKRDKRRTDELCDRLKTGRDCQ